MPQTKNLALIFAAVPEGYPKPGQDLIVKDIGIDLSEAPPSGGVVLEVLYSSFDPYMRGRLRPAHVKSYAPGFSMGEAMNSHGVGRVLASSHADFAAGDLVKGSLPIQQYVRLSAAQVSGPTGSMNLTKLPADPGFDVRHFIGALGMPGLTAYSSLYEIGRPQKGETIFISSAAGAVGQLVGQLAKHEGLRVVGSVGSDEKVAFVERDLGFDAGFNYKTEKPLDALRRLCPDGIDIYYENVGGEQLAAAIEMLNPFGRIVACGMISQYNLKPADLYPFTNLMQFVAKRLSMRGFIVSDKDFGPKWSAEHYEKVSAWLKDGSFKATLHETVGMEHAAEGFVGMLKGENFGKAVLKVKV